MKKLLADEYLIKNHVVLEGILFMKNYYYLPNSKGQSTFDHQGLQNHSISRPSWLSHVPEPLLQVQQSRSPSNKRIIFTILVHYL